MTKHRSSHNYTRPIALVVLAAVSLVLPTSSALGADKWGDGVTVGNVFPESGKIYTYNGTVNGQLHNRISQYLQWDSAQRMSALRQSNDAYEHEANFDGDGCFGVESGFNTGFSYHSSNIPFDYNDTTISDPQPPYSRAFGSAYSNNLQPGTEYYYRLIQPVYGEYGSNCESASGTKYYLAAQDSHRSGSCSAGYTWCVFGDSGFPRDIVPRSAGWKSGTTRSYRTNQLTNDSFENGTSSWVRRAAPGGAVNWALYGGAYEQSNRLDFNCASTVAGCSIHQDVAFNPFYQDLFYAEVVVKCQSSSSCPISFALWGLGVSTNEAISESHNVPADGKWHRYKMRGTHYGLHNTMRLEVYNSSSWKTVSTDMFLLHWSDTSSAPNW